MNRKIINNALASLSDGKTNLQDFITRASQLDPAISQALAGIYCGTCDKQIPTACATLHEPLEGTKYWLRVGWYADPNSTYPPKVEYAYIS